MELFKDWMDMLRFERLYLADVKNHNFILSRKRTSRKKPITSRKNRVKKSKKFKNGKRLKKGFK